MEIKNFTITKRDGSKDQFSLDKIMNAIVKAFESVNEPADLGIVSKILNHQGSISDETIARVGELSGYPDQFYFSRTFRKETGENPTSYRKKTRVDQDSRKKE